MIYLMLFELLSVLGFKNLHTSCYKGFKDGLYLLRSIFTLHSINAASISVILVDREIVRLHNFAGSKAICIYSLLSE